MRIFESIKTCYSTVTSNPVFQVGRSGLFGLLFFQSRRAQHVLGAAWNEQQTLYAIQLITDISMLVITSNSNLKFLEKSGVTFFGRKNLTSLVTRMKYLSYLSVPTLQYGIKKCEKKDWKKTKDALVFTLIHIPDLIMTASIVQCAVAARKGFNRIGNAVQIACLVAAIGEQGLYWTKPKDNAGLLFDIKEGDFVRAYTPLFNGLYRNVGIPLSFFYKGVVGKIMVIFTLTTRFKPTFLGRFIPQYIKDIFATALKNREKLIETINTEIVAPSASEKNPTDWIGNVARQKYEMTQKGFEFLELEDFFQDIPWQTLERDVQNCLRDDTSLSEEDREKLEDLLGKNGYPGSLRKEIDRSTTPEERTRNLRILKNIFGPLKDDWKMKKTRLLADYKDLKKCKTAVIAALHILELEFSLERFQASTPAEAQLINGISLVLQTMRNRVMGQMIDFISMAMMSAKSKFEEKEGKELSARYEAIFDAPFAEKWAALKSYLELAWIKYLLDLGAWLGDGTRSIHLNNLIVTLLGSSTNISNYEEAKRDLEQFLSFIFIDKELLKFVVDYFDPLIKTIFDASFANTDMGRMLPTMTDSPPLGELEATFTNPGDPRLKPEWMKNYLFKQFPEKSAQFQNELMGMLLEEDPDDLPPDYAEKLEKAFIENYLIQLLYNLGYYVEKPPKVIKLYEELIKAQSSGLFGNPYLFNNAQSQNYHY